MDPNQERLKDLKSIKLNRESFFNDGKSKENEGKFETSQNWLKNYEEYLPATTPRAARRNDETREYPSGLTNEFVDNLLPRMRTSSKQPTANDIASFVNNLTRRNCTNSIESQGDNSSSAVTPPGSIVRSSSNTSVSTSQFNYQHFSNKFDDSPAPAKKPRIVERETSRVSNPPSSTQQKSAVEIALRQRNEETVELKKTISEMQESNKIVLADNSSLQIDFKTARQQHHLNEIKNKSNKHTGPSPRIGLSKNFTKSSFKSPMMIEDDKEESSKNKTPGVEDEHPLMKNIDPEILEKIKKEITVCTENISFEDVAGLDEAKKVIYEAVVLPLLRPDIFTGLRSAPKGILLFGPPGTGKTMIGKCIARQAKATFFCISSAALTSKWIGEGEKLVRALFLYARVKQPSVIFIDEIDSILTRRSENECEANRRLKTEFLIQLEGATSNVQDNVLLIGATNLPQELDEAAKRRFTKRLYIPLPDKEARRQLLTSLLRLNDNRINERELEWIARSTEGYSGSDINNLCKDAAMQPLREIPAEELMKTDVTNFRPIALKDFQESLKCVKATVSNESLESYIKWNEAYGSTKM